MSQLATEQGLASVGRLAAGNSGFLFLSFSASALMNALPQIFYARYAGEERALWLSISLFMSAILSLAGNWSAQSASPLFRSSAVFYGTAAATVTLVLACAYQNGVPVPAFFLCQLLLAFAMACFLQLLDRRLSGAAGSRHRQTNDLLTNLFRFVGILLGPLWFWLFAPGTGAALLGTGVLALSVVLSLFSVRTSRLPQLPAETTPKRSAFIELLFLGFAVMVYATYCLLSASLAYMLSELTGEDSSRQALLYIIVIFAAAVGFTALCLVFTLRLDRRMMVFAPAVIAFAGYLIPLMLDASLGLQLTLCTVFGVGYGSFMLVLRDVLSDFALRKQSSHFIAWFNNVPNYGAILGFGLMATISLVCRLAGFSFAAVVAFCVCVCAGVQVVLALYFLASGAIGASTPAFAAAPQPER